MSASSTLYAKFLLSVFDAKVHLETTPVKLAILKSTYTPAGVTTDQYWSTVSSDEVSGTGYTAGGKAVTGQTLTLTTATDWSTGRAASTAYTVGVIVRPATANGHLYRCAVAGTSGASTPTWPTVLGETVADGTVTWTTMGTAILVYKFNTVRWSTVTFTDGAYAVAYVEKTAATTSPLMSLFMLPSSQSPVNQTFEVIPSSTGWWAFTPPS